MTSPLDWSPLIWEDDPLPRRERFIQGDLEHGHLHAEAARNGLPEPRGYRHHGDAERDAEVKALVAAAKAEARRRHDSEVAGLDDDGFARHLGACCSCRYDTQEAS